MYIEFQFNHYHQIEEDKNHVLDVFLIGLQLLECHSYRKLDLSISMDVHVYGQSQNQKEVGQTYSLSLNLGPFIHV